jgi:hypothetical protein
VQPLRGAKYRLERGKGYGQANWWVLSLDGRTEVAGGLLYEDAKEIYDRCEESIRNPGRVCVTLNPAIIDFEEQSRAEMRERRRKRNATTFRD